MRKSRPRNKREPEDDWPPPTLANFKVNPEPYRMRDGTEVYLTSPNPIVRLIVHKKTVEELLGIKKPEE